VLRTDLISPQTRALLVSVARIVLVAQRGSLFDQLDRIAETRLPPRVLPKRAPPTCSLSLRRRMISNSLTGWAASPMTAPSM
jgi:hypothetical protein